MDLFIDELVRTLLQALAPIVAAAVVGVLALAMKRIGLSISAENQARTEKLVHDAIFFAEERVSGYLKKGVKPVQSKLAIATQQVLDKIPGITQTEAEALIHTELPKLGIGAASFMRAVAVAATNDAK